MPKPVDFYVTVIDFFGALIPGAVIVCLHGTHLALLVNLSNLASPHVTWPAFFVAAYVIG